MTIKTRKPYIINLTTSWVTPYVETVLGKSLVKRTLRATGWKDLNDIQLGNVKNRLHTLKEFEVWDEIEEIIEEHNYEHRAARK